MTIKFWVLQNAEYLISQAIVILSMELVMTVITDIA